MEKQTFGEMITALRKEKGMTQLELADKMGITDKAVSKWERDLSFPDVGAIPRLADIFNVSVNELMQGRVDMQKGTKSGRIYEIIQLALKGVALAMGITVAVLSAMSRNEADPAISMLGIGLACLAITQLPKKKE